MKKFCFLVLILFLGSCSPDLVPERIELVDEPVAEEIVEEAVEDIVQVEESVIPLSMELTATPSYGELEVQSELHCIAKDGVPPYTYTWNQGGCSGDICVLTLTEIKNHSITCQVADTIGSAQATVTIEVDQKERKIHSIIGLGDSLTEGYGLQDPAASNWLTGFAKTYPDATLTNLAVGGSTSWGTREQLLQLQNMSGVLAAEKNKLIFLWVGANDIVRFVKLEDFETNYRFMVDTITAMDNTDLVLINIPDASQLPIADQFEAGVNALVQAAGINASVQVKEIGKDVIATYNAVVVKVAEDKNLPLIDMFTYLEELDESLITEDQFHPNEQGHEAMTRKVYQEMDQLFPTIEFS